MTATKKSKKASKNAVKSEATSSGKITLPAFGLAEEILEDPGSESDKRISESEAPKRVEKMRDILSELRTQNSEPASDGELHLVTFHLDAEEFGVDIGRVQEIIRIGQITVVPNAPEFIRGVINLRGKIIPVLDLRKRLTLPDASFDKNSRIIVVEAGPKVLGLLVDRVSQVIRMPAESVDAPPDELEESRAFVRGIGKIDSRLIMIMELDRILAKETWQATQHPKV